MFLSDANHAATLTVPLADIPTQAPLDLTLVDLGRSAEFEGPTAAAAVAQRSGLWAVLLSALFGGLILNLMPCVLPVLSLKLAGLTRLADAGEDRGSRRRAIRVGFAATGLGIVSCFLGIAAILVGLKWSGATLGWGIQFQQPWFLAGMAVVTVAVRGEPVRLVSHRHPAMGRSPERCRFGAARTGSVGEVPRSRDRGRS